MDFEWENGIGHVDQTSPFVTATRNLPNNTNGTAKKREHNIQSRTRQIPSNRDNLTKVSTGTHSVLDSPSKSGTQTPNLPRLREPASQSFYFNQPSPAKPLPSIPAHVSDPTLWNTPRTPKQIIDFSSGGETPNTPDQNGESEATPDTGMGMRSKMSRMFSSGGNGAKSATSGKGRRESWFSGLLAGSPRRGEVTKRDHYSTKGEKIIKRRRQKGLNKQALQQPVDEASDSEDDGAGKSKRSRKKGSKNSKNTSKENGDSKNEPKATQSNAVASIFSFIERHPALPHILSYYAQLLLNFFLVFSAIYILYSIWCAIITDVDIEAKKAAAETMAEIAVCAQNYRENRCERATRVPAMETVCSNWESCMQRDPKKVARASVSAKTFAMIFNSFVEPISYKTMVSICLSPSITYSPFTYLSPGLFLSKIIYQCLNPYYLLNHLKLAYKQLANSSCSFSQLFSSSAPSPSQTSHLVFFAIKPHRWLTNTLPSLMTTLRIRPLPHSATTVADT